MLRHAVFVLSAALPFLTSAQFNNESMISPLETSLKDPTTINCINLPAAEDPMLPCCQLALLTFPTLLVPAGDYVFTPYDASLGKPKQHYELPQVFRGGDCQITVDFVSDPVVPPGQIVNETASWAGLYSTAVGATVWCSRLKWAGWHLPPKTGLCWLTSGSVKTGKEGKILIRWNFPTNGAKESTNLDEIVKMLPVPDTAQTG